METCWYIRWLLQIIACNDMYRQMISRFVHYATHYGCFIFYRHINLCHICFKICMLFCMSLCPYVIVCLNGLKWILRLLSRKEIRDKKETNFPVNKAFYCGLHLQQKAAINFKKDMTFEKTGMFFLTANLDVNYFHIKKSFILNFRRSMYIFDWWYPIRFSKQGNRNVMVYEIW